MKEGLTGMSQEKVDRYKEAKKNRARDIKRAKVKKVLIAFAVAVVIGAGIGIPLGQWIYNYQKTHVKEEDVFIASREYEDWFNKYWVDNYSDFYTGAELATEDESTGPSSEPSSESETPASESETPASESGSETGTEA